MSHCTNGGEDPPLLDLFVSRRAAFLTENFVVSFLVQNMLAMHEIRWREYDVGSMGSMIETDPFLINTPKHKSEPNGNVGRDQVHECHVTKTAHGIRGMLPVKDVNLGTWL